MFARRQLTEKIAIEWLAKYEKAKLSVENKKQMMNALAEEIEVDLEVYIHTVVYLYLYICIYIYYASLNIYFVTLRIIIK